MYIYTYIICNIHPSSQLPRNKREAPQNRTPLSSLTMPGAFFSPVEVSSSSFAIFFPDGKSQTIRWEMIFLGNHILIGVKKKNMVQITRIRFLGKHLTERKKKWKKNEKMAVPKSGAPIPLPPVLNNTGRGFIHPSFFQGGIFPGFPPCNSSMVAIDLSTMALPGALQWPSP